MSISLVDINGLYINMNLPKNETKKYKAGYRHITTISRISFDYFRWYEIHCLFFFDKRIESTSLQNYKKETIIKFIDTNGRFYFVCFYSIL